MSQPTIPNISPIISIDRYDVVNLMLASIAMEELGLAHIINAEAEKLQYAIGTLPGLTTPVTLSQLLLVNQNVQSTLGTVIQTEMLLLSKLESLLQFPETT